MATKQQHTSTTTSRKIEMSTHLKHFSHVRLFVPQIQPNPDTANELPMHCPSTFIAAHTVAMATKRGQYLRQWQLGVCTRENTIWVKMETAIFCFNFRNRLLFSIYW